VHIVIATHGAMAKGVTDAVEILYGKKENYSFLEGYVHSENFEEEFNEHLSQIEDETIIVLTDLLGGSVNQIAARALKEKKIEVIAGINLALVLRVLGIDDNKDVPAQIRECIRQSQEQVLFVNKIIL